MTTKLDCLRIDMGNRCTHCGVDTSFGAGNGMFVNRIPSTAEATLVLSLYCSSDASTVTVDGYMCPDCQAVECDRCGERTLDYWHLNDGTATVCDDCMTAPELQEKVKERMRR